MLAVAMLLSEFLKSLRLVRKAVEGRCPDLTPERVRTVVLADLFLFALARRLEVYNLPLALPTPPNTRLKTAAPPSSSPQPPSTLSTPSSTLSSKPSTLDAVVNQVVERLGTSAPVGWVAECLPELRTWCNPPLHKRLAPLLDPLRVAVAQDPTLLGWGFQLFNQPLRAQSSWAVSRAKETSGRVVSIPVVTQLFTEEYMARWLIEHAAAALASAATHVTNTTHTPHTTHPARTLSPTEVFDPACGVGHILVQVVRYWRAAGVDGQALAQQVGASLFGADIDPSAVALTRAILLLEVASPALQCAAELAAALERAIVVVPEPFGSLERNSPVELLRRTYQCVLTNPPYLGRRKLEPLLRSFLDREYPTCALDLCAAFMLRCVELLQPDGSLGLVTIDKWLRLKGYAELRQGGLIAPGVLRDLTVCSLVELGARAFGAHQLLHDGVGTVLMVAQRRLPPPKHQVAVLDCTGGRSAAEKGELLAAQVSRRMVIQQELLRPGAHSALAQLGIPAALLRSGQTVQQCAQVVVGLQSSDDRRFVRFHWEVPSDQQGWRVHSKGGGYGRWYGLNRFVLNWGEGEPVFRTDPRSGISVAPLFERAGWSYTWFAHGALGLRQKEAGWSFGRAAASGVFCDDARLIAFLNSRLGSVCARRVGAKAQLSEGVVRSLPTPFALEPINAQLVDAAVALKRRLVARNPAEVTFSPAALRCHPAMPWVEQALLLWVEGVLDRQVVAAVGCSPTELAEVDAVLLPPVGWGDWEGGRSGHRTQQVADWLWGVVPPELQWLRELLPLPKQCHDLRDLHGADLTTVLQGRAAAGQRGPSALPIDLPLERVCRALRLHPLEALGWLAEQVEASADVAQIASGQLLRCTILQGVAEAIGHRWWSEQGSAHPVTPHRANPHDARLWQSVSAQVVCIDRVVAQVSEVLARHALDVAAWCGVPWGKPWCSESENLQTEVAEVPLQAWLLGATARQPMQVQEDFLRWQERVFFGKPLVQRVKQGSEVYFMGYPSHSKK